MTAATPPAPGLLDRYREPHRAYHTLEHVHDCLDRLAEVPGLAADERRLLEHAIWWHDAIYDPTRADNEERSAALAEAELADLGFDADHQSEVARLILLTKGHTAEAGDRSGALLVSIDLSVLGAEPEAYDRYAHAIRREYAHVPEPLYRAGRAAVLRRFLDSPSLFADPGFRERYERRARENLARELERLAA